MAGNVAENISVSLRDVNRSSCELLAWLNETLQTNFTKLEQVCTGAAFCQLMDCLFPGSLDLSSVQFQSDNFTDCVHNYSLLQAAFRKVAIDRYLPIEALLGRNPRISMTFLQWFKLFFDENNTGREYQALEARGGQSLLPDKSHRDGTPPQKLQSIMKMDGKTEEGPKKEKPRENVNGNADVVLFISDDEDDLVIVEQKRKKMAVKEGSAQLEQMKSEEQTQAAVENGTQWSSFHTLLSFIRRYCNNVDTNFNSPHTQVSGPSVLSILSPAHLRDIVQSCYETPYCLYLYMKVELGEGQTTSIILIGYVDQRSGVSVVRLLRALQMSVDSDPQSSGDRDTSTGTHAADADACLLIETLMDSGLHLSNLVVFYCDAPQPAVSQVFVSHLQAFSPRLVSLCGLPGMAERACQAGLLPSFGCVVDLVRDIHHHYSTCISINDSLKEIFAGAESYNPYRPLSAQCLFIISTVQRMVSSWRDLVEYFKSLRQSEEAERIRNQLMDYKVKLRFQFLSQTLEPLQALQVLQKYAPADVAGELQLSSTLVQSYAVCLLRPSALEHFLRDRDQHVLCSERELLSTAEVDIGSRARDFLWATAVVDLGEQDRSDFLKDVVAFYKATLQSLVQSVPKTLGDVALMNISKVLKHPENINGNLTAQELTELVVQLGLCDPGSPETHQLAYDYFSVIKKVREEQVRGTGSQCWAKVLRGIRPHSVLRRFLLTLLALPSSLCRTQVFAKAFNSTRTLPFSKETSEASPQLGSWARRPRPRRRRQPAQVGLGDDETSSDDCDGFVAKPSLCIPFKPDSSKDDSDYTDNSSDVIDVTEESKVCPTSLTKTESPTAAEFVYIVSEDDDDSTPTSSEELLGAVGELVWVEGEGFSPWPAVIVTCVGGERHPGKRMVELFGQRTSSQVHANASCTCRQVYSTRKQPFNVVHKVLMFNR